MREIKFRAWDTEREIMAQVDHLGLDDYEVNMKDSECKRWRASYPYVCRLMQYTGLKDMNGREIYEGDIVKYFIGELAVIKYMNGSFVIESENDLDCMISMYGKIEVVGNIFENPELLEEMN